MSGDSTFPHFATNVLHQGQDPEQWSSMAVVPPITTATTFKQNAPGDYKQFEYTRGGNPTRNCLEAALAACEDAKHALAFASGLAATESIVKATLKCSEHLIAMDDLYGGTNRFFRRVASNMGIETTFVDMTDPDNVRKAIKPNTRLIWVETPTNPTLKIIDITAISNIAHTEAANGHKIRVAVDNTFTSSYFQRPLSLGADIVMHSMTKYMNGHTDVLMGSVMTSDDEFHEKVRFIQFAVGAVPSPFDCYLVNRSLKTLHLRMREHQRNGLEVAKFLETHPCVTGLKHPGLPSHPQHEIAKKQMKGFSGMVCMYVKGGLQETSDFLKNLKVFTLAESLGGYESLAEHPAIMTHASISEEEREKLGIHSNFVRLSVGLEDIEDLKADLDQALRKACKV